MAKKFGRKTKYNKPLNEMLRILITEDHVSELADLARKSGTDDVSTWAREVLLGEQSHPLSHPAMSGTDSFRAKFLTKAPCGDWKEAIDFASDYVLSADVAHSLEARSDDVVVQADGDSMEDARIHDGDLVLMRPLQDGRRPVRGEITLVQIIRKNGECEGMIKRWMRSEPVELHNGKGEAVSIPKDTVEIKAVAVARGLIARL